MNTRLDRLLCEGHLPQQEREMNGIIREDTALTNNAATPRKIMEAPKRVQTPKQLLRNAGVEESEMVEIMLRADEGSLKPVSANADDKIQIDLRSMAHTMEEWLKEQNIGYPMNSIKNDRGENNGCFYLQPQATSWELGKNITGCNAVDFTSFQINL